MGGVGWGESTNRAERKTPQAASESGCFYVTPEMKVKLLQWLRKTRDEAEKNRRAREQMAETFSIGSDADWRAAAKAHGGPVITKSDRDKESAKHLRIAAHYQDDIDSLELLLWVMEKM